MEEADKPKAVPQLDAARFQPIEFVSQVYAITVEQGITRSEILNPAFWGQIAARLRPYDEIRVRCDDGSIYANLLVLNAERAWARVHVLAWADLTTRDVSLTEAAGKAKGEPGEPARSFRIEYKGPHKKFCVIRNSDNAYIREGEANKHDAEVWLSDYERVTA